MSLPKMTTPVNNISLLDDLPNAVGGLSAAELKARFDKAGGDIQTFLNETLIPAIEQMGVAEGTARDEAIQAAIDALELDTTVENLQKAIVAAESRAKEYADTKDAANLAAAKQYAAGEAAAAASAAVNAAAADATSKANAVLSYAKSYTDDKAAAVLAEAALVSGSDAQNAETAAKQYADTQDAATLTAAKEYTDGKIPSKLPNPQKLKFTGAVTGEYDGSEEKTINIPSGGSADLPPVLGNLGTEMADAAEGAIPIADGANGWTTGKLIKAYTGDKDLIGYIPATEWVAAYMAAQKELLKLLPDSAAADAGKLLKVGADGAAAWGDKLPTALKNPKALTFTGAATGTYDGSEGLTITIPEGGSGGSTGGGLRKMSAVASYIGIPVAELPQDGTVWMCISKGDGAELYSGTVTIEGGSLTANNLIAVSSGSVIQLNQATTTGAGFVIYGMSATDYVGVWQQVGAGSAAINWRGEWAEATKYSKLDAVSYEGSSYVFASDTPSIGAIPGVDGEWQLMAQKGDPGSADLSLSVTGATVGQIAKITAVDASGKPTAWEPVDMPSGGDESDFEKVVEMTTPEDAAVISISTDKNGDPLSMSEFYVAITTACNNAAAENKHFNCNVLPDTVPSNIRAASAITNITLFQDVYCYVMHYKLIGRMIFNECVGRQRTASGLNVAEYIENEKSISISAVVSEETIGFLSPTDARTGESKVNSAGKMYCITFGANSTDCIFGAGTRVEVWAR